MSKHHKSTKPKKQLRDPKGQVSQKTTKPVNDFFDTVIGNKAIFLVLAIILFIGIWIFKDYLTFEKLYIFKDIGSDTYNAFVPFYTHNSEYFRTDGIPMWSFNTGMGQNIFPGSLNSPFYLLLCLPSKENIGYVIVYVELLKLLLGGMLFFFYLRTLRLSRYVSIIGGVLYAFTGFMIVGGTWYGYSINAVNIALLLLGFEKLFSKNNFLILPLAVMFISYSAFELFTYGLFLFIYSLVRYMDEKEWDLKQFSILTGKMAALGVIGVAMNAMLFVSPLITMLLSPRVSGASGHFQSLQSVPVFAFDNFSTLTYSGGLPLHHLKTAILRMFSSDLMGTGKDFRGWYNYLEAPMFYSGLLTLLMVPSVFAYLDKKHKRIYGLFLSLWGILILFPYFRYAYNLFAGDYYKVGISLIVTLVLLYYGMKSLDLYLKAEKINFGVIAASYAGLMLLLFLPYYDEKIRIINTDLRNKLALFLSAYFICIWLLRFIALRNIIQILLILILIIELGSLSWISTNKRMIMTKNETKQKTGYNDYSQDAVDYIKSIDSGFYRVNKMFFSGTSMHTSFNDAQIQGYYGTPNYASFNQLNYINFLAQLGVIRDTVETETRWAIGLINRPLLQVFASVKYNIYRQPPGGFYNFGYDTIARFGDVTVQKSNFFLPLGFTYNTVIPYNVFEKMSMPAREILLLNAFVADKKDSSAYNMLKTIQSSDTSVNYTFDDLRTDVNARRKDTLTITSHKQNIIKGSISLDSTKLMFFSIPFDKGWKCLVNGKEQTLKMVNIGFTGLLLDKGKHTIELRFTPSYLRESVMISIGGFIIYSILIFLYLRRMNKPEPDRNLQTNDVTKA